MRISEKRKREWREGLADPDDPIYQQLAKIRSLADDAIAAHLKDKDFQRKLKQLDREMKKVLEMLRSNQQPESPPEYE